MFRDNTVFIVGAGASAEFNLPVGSKLMATIRSNCQFELDQYGGFRSGRSEIFNHYERIYGRNDASKVAEFNTRLEAFKKIHDGIESADSIDEFIFRYPDDSIIAEVGKMHIAYAISQAERGSTLFAEFRNPINWAASDKTWIWQFAKALFNGVRAHEIDTIGDNITIICFNYDRCIEHYLEQALQRSYHGISPERARAVVKRIQIIHPYGSLGDVDAFAFGDTKQFARMAENLITWSETIENLDPVLSMTSAIGAARSLVFLGFAFARQNMDLMTLPRQDRATEVHGMILNQYDKDVYATAYGFKRQVHRKIQQKIVELWNDSMSETQAQTVWIESEEMTCYDFFRVNLMNLVQ